MIKINKESFQITKTEFFIWSTYLKPEIKSFVVIDKYIKKRMQIIIK